MSDKHKSDSQSEKREYFRVNQDVLFDYKVVDSYTAEESNADTTADELLGMTAATELRKIDSELQQSLLSLGRKDAALADTLSKLNKKIDKILQYNILNTDENKHNKSRINLSEGGLAFKSNRALYKGNYLLMRLVFLPGYLPMVLFAKVARCEAKDDEFHIAARFHRLEEINRKELAKQLLKAQSLSKRREAAKKAQ